MSKTSIYLEVEDDITSIIEKVKTADALIVAIIPPKRSAVLQSAVNLKLLKKRAKLDSKKIVLITKDPALLPLAGSVGVYVANSLSSRPYIPDTPVDDVDGDLVIDDELGVEQVLNTPVGILKKTMPKEPTDSEVKTSPSGKLSGLLGLPKLKGRIPNFNKFRTKLILGGVFAVLLMVGWYVGFYVLPKANVLVNAQTNRVRLEFDVTLDDKAESDDTEELILTTSSETLEKSFSETVPATGEENIGEKATGSIVIKNCNRSTDDLSIPAGSLFIASTGHRFRTSEAVEDIPGGEFTAEDGCVTPGEKPVDVIAEDSGTSSNLASGLSYTASGYTSVTGTGGKMSGGTDDVQKVVSQDDIDEAAEILGRSTHEEFIEELAAQFSLDTTPINPSFKVKEGKPTGEPAVGQPAEEVLVTLTYTYTMRGVSTDSLNKIIEKQLTDEMGSTILVVYDNGIGDASMKLDGDKVAFIVNSFIGPALDADSIAEEISGLRFSAAKKLLEEKDGVNSVSIDLSPFWVFSMPSKDKINVTIEIAEHALQERP